MTARLIYAIIKNGAYLTQEDLKKILYTVYKNIRCPSCGQQYDFGHIHIKGYVGNLCFLQLECSDHLPLYATIATPKDKQIDDANRPLDDNYIIRAYEILQNYSGNITDLLK